MSAIPISWSETDWSVCVFKPPSFEWYFKFRRSQKSHGTMSGEYGGCLSYSMMCCAKKIVTELQHMGRSIVKNFTDTKLWYLVSNSILKVIENSHVIFLADSFVFGEHTYNELCPAAKENCQHNLHIASQLLFFLWPWECGIFHWHDCVFVSVL